MTERLVTGVRGVKRKSYASELVAREVVVDVLPDVYFKILEARMEERRLHEDLAG